MGGRNLLNYGAALTVRGLEVLGKFGLYALAARQLGAHDSGLFFFCLTWVNVSSTAARMGLERATIRHMAAEIAIGRGRAARRAGLTGFSAASLASILAAVLTVAAAKPAALYLFHQPDLAAPLRLSALILPAQTITWATSFLLLGLNRGVTAQLVLSALPPVLSLIALLAGLDDLDRLLVAYALSFSVCGVIGMAVIAHDWPRKLIDKPPPPGAQPEPLPSLWTSARPFLVVEMTQIIVLSLPTLLLGAFARPAAVSEFSIASRLSNLVNTVVISIGMVVGPSFAEHHRRREYQLLRRKDRQARLLILVMSLPVILAMLFAPRFLLRLLGSEFGDAWPVLIVLAVGQLVNCLLPYQDNILAMIGEGVVLRRLNLMQLFTSFALGLLLIPHMGMMGAAFTTAGTLILYTLICALTVSRTLPKAELPLAAHRA